MKKERGISVVVFWILLVLAVVAVAFLVFNSKKKKEKEANQSLTQQNDEVLNNKVLSNSSNFKITEAFDVSHTKTIIDTSNTLVYTNCLYVEFFNRGETPVVIGIGELQESEVLYTMMMGESMIFPRGGNSNPSMQITDTFNIDFAGEDECSLIVTKAFSRNK